jgi:hypothetical protein
MAEGRRLGRGSLGFDDSRIGQGKGGLSVVIIWVECVMMDIPLRGADPAPETLPAGTGGFLDTELFGSRVRDPGAGFARI